MSAQGVNPGDSGACPDLSPERAALGGAHATQTVVSPFQGSKRNTEARSPQGSRPGLTCSALSGLGWGAITGSMTPGACGLHNAHLNDTKRYPSSRIRCVLIAHALEQIPFWCSGSLLTETGPKAGNPRGLNPAARNTTSENALAQGVSSGDSGACPDLSPERAALGGAHATQTVVSPFQGSKRNTGARSPQGSRPGLTCSALSGLGWGAITEWMTPGTCGFHNAHLNDTKRYPSSRIRYVLIAHALSGLTYVYRGRRASGVVIDLGNRHELL